MSKDFEQQLADWQRHQYELGHGPAQPYYQQAPPVANPRKKRRVFLWVFLAVQVIFIAWLIGGIASTHGVPAYCHSHASVSDQNACKQASDVGSGIAMVLIFGLWVGVDFILAVVYGIYRLAKR